MFSNSKYGGNSTTVWAKLLALIIYWYCWENAIEDGSLGWYFSCTDYNLVLMFIHKEDALID